MRQTPTASSSTPAISTHHRSNAYTSSRSVASDVLALVSPTCHLQVRDIPAADTAHWAAMLDLAAMHRLLPQLHWYLNRTPEGRPMAEDLGVDTDIRQTLEGAFRQSTFAALEHQRELLLLGRILQTAGIPFLALKGAYLAFHVYPHAALRPLRDLDILIPRDQIRTAYRLLLENGYTRSAHHEGDVDAWMDISHQLPALISPNGRVCIELHSRLCDPDELRGRQDLSQDPGLWTRAMHQNVAGHVLSFMAPEDLLLHLIIHAVDQHLFDNGPLTFSDVAHLVQTHALDWALFWSQARTYQQLKGASLVLGIAQRLHDPLNIEWSADSPPVPDDVLTNCALLSLRNLNERGDIAAMSRLSLQTSLADKCRVVMERMFPTPQRLSYQYAVKADSPLLPFYYFYHLFYLMTQRLPALLRQGSKQTALDTAGQMAQVRQWLDV